jgi:hypothetical protein
VQVVDAVAQVSCVAVVAPGAAGKAVAVYCVMAAPPSAGAVHDTLTERSPAVAVTCVGALGGPTGTTGAEDRDTVEVRPDASRAMTVNV